VKPGGFGKGLERDQVTPPSPVREITELLVEDVSERNPRCTSAKNSALLQSGSVASLCKILVQLAPASEVRRIAYDWLWHCVAAEPGELTHPCRALMNAMSPIGTPEGTPRSSHVEPRSLDRKSRELPTRAHTKSPDGALMVVTLGNAIGVPVGVAGGEGVGLCVAVAVAVAVTAGVLLPPEGLGDEAAGAQAAVRRTSARAPMSLTSS
jgi:hypothetical protein